MDSNKKREIPKRGVDIDHASFNLVLVIIVTIILMLAILASYFAIMLTAKKDEEPKRDEPDTEQQSGDEYPLRQDVSVDIVYNESDVESITGIESQSAVIIDVTTGVVVAGKRSGGEISPASMTKIMTLIVVIENLKGDDPLNAMVSVTEEHISHKTSERKVSGYLGNTTYPAGEYSVSELLYHLMLDSSGVAALALADYIAGSEAAFVKLMNEKAEELELERTSFVYCDGSDDIGHVSTCRDIAKIMAYAVKNTFCYGFMIPHSFVDSNERTLYNKPLVHHFYQKNGTYSELSPKNAKITAAKTGWTGSFSGGESGGCLVSYAKGKNGRNYVIVTAGAPKDTYSESIAVSVSDTIKICNDYIQ